MATPKGFTVRLPPEKYDAFRRYADLQGKSLNELATAAIEMHLALKPDAVRGIPAVREFVEALMRQEDG